MQTQTCTEGRPWEDTGGKLHQRGRETCLAREELPCQYLDVQNQISVSYAGLVLCYASPRKLMYLLTFCKDTTIFLLSWFLSFSLFSFYVFLRFVSLPLSPVSPMLAQVVLTPPNRITPCQCFPLRLVSILISAVFSVNPTCLPRGMSWPCSTASPEKVPPLPPTTSY